MDLIDGAAYKPSSKAEQCRDGKEPFDAIGPGDERCSTATSEILDKHKESDNEVDLEQQEPPSDRKPEGLYISFIHQCFPYLQISEG